MDLYYVLIANILLASLLIGISIWLSEYNMKWWLRNQRADRIWEDFYKKWVLMEIKIPKEIYKSPAAMEVVLNSLYQIPGYKNDPVFNVWKKGNPFYANINLVRKEFYEKYVRGNMRMWSSLEIISEEGKIRFFILTLEKFSEVVKSNIYSQYPGIEVTEAEDYTKKFDWVKGGAINAYFGRFKLADKDYLPIKTYVDYGLDKDPKEEFKVDPLTPMLEAFASAGPGENFWFQILVRPTVNKDWKKDTEKRIDEILGIKREDKKIVSQERPLANLTPNEKHEVEILQKNIEKNAFDTIIKLFYIAEKDKFNAPKGTFNVINSMKSFGKPGYNSFALDSVTWDADHPFLDPKSVRSDFFKNQTWKHYKLRTGYYFEAEGGFLLSPIWFFTLWRDISFEYAMNYKYIVEEYLVPDTIRELDKCILNTEELATIFHFPGKTFSNDQNRVESIKSDPPRNLPI